MGNKLSCTTSNKEDKADAKADKKAKENKPVEKAAEEAETTVEAKPVATVEIARPEGENATTETPAKAEEKAEEKAEDKAEEQAEVKPEEDKKEEEVVNVAQVEVTNMPKLEMEVPEPVVTSSVHVKETTTTTTTTHNDDIREDIVQAVTIETVKLSVTDYIDEGKAEAPKEVTNAAEQIQTTVEKYDSPEDIAKAKENFLLQFRNDHKIHGVDFMRIWRNYDKDISGYLEKKELTKFVKDLLEQKGQKSDKKTVSAYETIMMSSFDANKDGKLELNELAKLLPAEQNFLAKFPGRNNCSREDFNKIFDHFDKDQSGSIGHTELTALMKDLFEKEGPHHMQVPDIKNYADGVFDVFDTDQDGRLSKDELSLILSKS